MEYFATLHPMGLCLFKSLPVHSATDRAYIMQIITTFRQSPSRVVESVWGVQTPAGPRDSGEHQTQNPGRYFANSLSNWRRQEICVQHRNVLLGTRPIKSIRLPMTWGRQIGPGCSHSNSTSRPRDARKHLQSAQAWYLETHPVIIVRFPPASSSHCTLCLGAL